MKSQTSPVLCGPALHQVMRPHLISQPSGKERLLWTSCVCGAGI